MGGADHDEDGEAYQNLEHYLDEEEDFDDNEVLM